MSATLQKHSPCKVNLILNILGRRPDGFHELETVMHPVALHDELAFARLGRGSSQEKVRLTCSEKSLPTDAGNLVHRAAGAFLDKANIVEAVSIHLEKRIPMAAGLGGGSGNAATTLLGLNELFDGPLPAQSLHEIAASLGSDIPFFLQSQPALATGRGEVIQPLLPFRALQGAAFLLIHPGFGIATAWAYKELARFPAALNGRRGRAEALVRLLETSNIEAAGAEFYNSLEGPALEKYPLLALYQEFLRAHGALAAMMSGSGSTTFAVLRSSKDAESLEEQVKSKFGPCWTTVVPI